MKKIVLGISGYIGSGKSEAGRYFKSKGAYFIDADVIVDKIYEWDGAGFDNIKNFFGERFLFKNGGVNRKKLGRFVFSDVNKLKILNNLIHPLVAKEIKLEMEVAINEKVVVIEAVYLEGRHMLEIVDRKLWVECGEKQIYTRALQKAKYKLETVKNILEIQKEIKIRPEKPDFVVDNSGDISDFKKRLDKVWKELIGC